MSSSTAAIVFIAVPYTSLFLAYGAYRIHAWRAFRRELRELDESPRSS